MANGRWLAAGGRSTAVDGPAGRTRATVGLSGQRSASYDDGGDRHVAAYLAQLDISDFNAKAPPPKTQAFWEIASANRAPEDAELQDVLDDLGQPNVFTVDQVLSRASSLQLPIAEWLRDKANARRAPKLLGSARGGRDRDSASKFSWRLAGHKVGGEIFTHPANIRRFSD
jgi:hypothetical protein